MREMSNSNIKSRFFKEMKQFIEDAKEFDTSEELLIPGSGLYKSPYAKNSNSSASMIEPSDIVYTDDELTYRHTNEQRLHFAAARSDLPQFFIDSRVQVRMTPNMGKGCFATKDIEKNTIVESSPVILVHQDTFSNLNDYNGGTHKLSEYPFSWGRDGISAIALGYGGIYNHRVEPNLVWRPDYESESLLYTAVRDISAGEELFIRYVPLTKLDVLWFEDEESQRYAEIYRKNEKENSHWTKLQF